MTRRGGMAFLAVSLAIFGLCAGLIAWRLAPRPAPKSTAAAPEEVTHPATQPSPSPAKISTIIDLPGDPVLVRRGVVVAPREVDRLALPIKVAANATKIEGPGYFVAATLVSTDGGYMGKFPEAGQEADALAAQLALNAAAMAGGADAAQIDAGFDDDGGEATPEDAQSLLLTDANSNQLEVAVSGKPQLKQEVLRTVVAQKIADLLIANGYSEESARAIENAAKSVLNVQTLPARGIALAAGALDPSGAYRATQLAIYEDREYVGAVALAENGAYGESARPEAPEGLLDDSSKNVVNTHFTLADGVYSAGLRNGMPEPVIREGIQMLGRVTDLKAALPADETIRALYTRDFRDKSKSSGKIVYIGLTGSAGAFDCYAFEGADGFFRCFDPKGGASVPLPPTFGGGLGESGAMGVGGILAPIKGAPVTSLFGMRFHPILHILRLHAGIDFGAPVGSQVRASADGKVEIAGPVSGFGNHIRIQHKGFETSYSHLSEIPATIKPGTEVKEGEIIALSGNTGLSTGPHLHFQFYLNGAVADPLPHLGSEVQASAPTGAAAAARVSSNAVASEAEIAAFPAVKAQVDAALEAAAR